MPRATAIHYTGDSSSFVIKPLLMTTPQNTWLKASNELAYDSTLPPCHPQEGDSKGDSFVTALQLTRQVKGKEQHIIVCSNADFISNELAVNSSQGSFHGELFTAICSWLGYNEYPLYLPGAPPKDVSFRIGAAGATALETAYIWILPAILLLAGSVWLIRRRRK
jgi:ABC-2 type transport system permease protein